MLLVVVTLVAVPKFVLYPIHHHGSGTAEHEHVSPHTALDGMANPAAGASSAAHGRHGPDRAPELSPAPAAITTAAAGSRAGRVATEPPDRRGANDRVEMPSSNAAGGAPATESALEATAHPARAGGSSGAATTARAASAPSSAHHHGANADGVRVHVVFSTDCTPFQHWQARAAAAPGC